MLLFLTSIHPFDDVFVEEVAKFPKQLDERANVIAQIPARLLSELKKMLLEQYDVEPGQLEKDWDDFYAQLREANLLDI